MIRIHRPPDAPEVLRCDGVARREAHEIEVDADRTAFEAGDATLAFDRGIYGHPSVKAALVAMQHEKCAFCEAKPLHVSDGDVEHFRPKGAVRQTDSEGDAVLVGQHVVEQSHAGSFAGNQLASGFGGFGGEQFPSRLRHQTLQEAHQILGANRGGLEVHQRVGVHRVERHEITHKGDQYTHL